MNIQVEQLNSANKNTEMVNTFFLCRFDTQVRLDVSSIIADHLHVGSVPEFIRSSNILITIFKSQSSMNEINLELGNLNPDCAYFLFDVSNSPMALNFPKEIMNHFKNVLGIIEQQKEEEYTIDYLLDEIQKRGGKDKLNVKELEALNRLSQQTGH